MRDLHPLESNTPHANNRIAVAPLTIYSEQMPNIPRTNNPKGVSPLITYSEQMPNTSRTNNPKGVSPLIAYSEQMPNIPHANNRIAVGLLVEQSWRVKRAYPVYDVQRENKAVGLGLFDSLKLGGWRDCFDLLS